MDEQALKEAVIRSEGYAQGFKDGFLSCARTITEHEKNKVPAGDKDKGQVN